MDFARCHHSHALPESQPGKHTAQPGKQIRNACNHPEVARVTQKRCRVDALDRHHDAATDYAAMRQLALQPPCLVNIESRCGIGCNPERTRRPSVGSPPTWKTRPRPCGWLVAHPENKTVAGRVAGAAAPASACAKRTASQTTTLDGEMAALPASCEGCSEGCSEGCCWRHRRLLLLSWLLLLLELLLRQLLR